jgi:hypothetical protein
MPNAILDPAGGAGAVGAALPGGAAAGLASGAALAPRPRDLRGARVGLLMNTKQNAGIFLDEVGRLLVDSHGAASVLARTKLAFARAGAGEGDGEGAAE